MSWFPVNIRPIRPGLAIAGALFAGGFACNSSATDAALTTNSGIYSTEQAERGKQAYAANCAMCHGTALTGQGAPALAGPFWTAWNRRTLDELYLLTQGSMPQQAPESLPPQDYTDILAYMLQVGGYPAGSQPLRAETAAAIRIEPRS